MKNQKGITLIALIITIILMLILVAVSVTVALNGGLFSTAKKGASQTEIAAEKETMVSIAMGAVKQDGQVDFAKLKNNLPEGFEEISEGKYKSTKTGVIYTVERYGTLTYEEPFDAEEWDSNASEEDCFVWASDTPGTPGYGTVIGYTAKAQGNTKLVFPSRCTKIEYPDGYYTSEEYGESRSYVHEIEKIEIPGTMTSIEWSTFNGKTLFMNVKEVNIGNGVTSIGGYAFEGCTNLINITIPDSVEKIGENAFKGTRWYEMQENGVVYVGKIAYEYKGKMPTNTNIEIKPGTKYIADAMFCECEGLKSVIIPDSVTNIGYSAFEGCINLTNVIIPNSVTDIGIQAFYYAGLTNITLPESVTNIGERAFDGTPWYKSQEDGVKYIGKVLYEYKGTMPSNTNIEIKDGTVMISGYAFADCTGLKNITIPGSVTSIGEYAFSDCTGLTSVTIPNNVTSIGTEAFSKCTSLTTITIPNNIRKIEYGTFRYCSALKTVTIPDSVEVIGNVAFDSCTSLENVTISRNVKKMEEAAFGNCTSLSNIVIWQNVDELGYRTFEGWGSTQTVNIEAKSTPTGWHSNWNYGCNAKIEYGYTGQ